MYGIYISTGSVTLSTNISLEASSEQTDTYLLPLDQYFLGVSPYKH